LNKKQAILIVVNGRFVQKEAIPGISLADFLHENLNLTGTKVSCEMGICKACTVAIKPVGSDQFLRAQACITPVTALAGYQILTVEGLTDEPSFKPLQEAFLKHFSFQCGYCAPGFLMGASLLIEQLKAHPVKSEAVDDAISESLGDHVCRCTGYVRYYTAIKEVILNTPGLIAV
jgi:aerobic-type carbon monoxide dehydrogenase small subunit (CoxS/CutS family)